MKVWTLILLVISSLAVNSQTCPSEHFAAVLTATVDQIVDDPTSVIVDDSELTFFKNYLKFRDSDIQHTIDDAIQFFNNTYMALISLTHLQIRRMNVSFRMQR